LVIEFLVSFQTESFYAEDFAFFKIFPAKTSERFFSDLSYVEPARLALALASLEENLRSAQKSRSGFSKPETNDFDFPRETDLNGIYPREDRSGSQTYWLGDAVSILTDF
jgi:hypothetical protein